MMHLAVSYVVRSDELSTSINWREWAHWSVLILVTFAFATVLADTAARVVYSVPILIHMTILHMEMLSCLHADRQ